MEHEKLTGLVLSLLCLAVYRRGMFRQEESQFTLHKKMYHEGIKTTFSVGTEAINAACFPPFS